MFLQTERNLVGLSWASGGVRGVIDLLLVRLEDVRLVAYMPTGRKGLIVNWIDFY